MKKKIVAGLLIMAMLLGGNAHVYKAAEIKADPTFTSLLSSVKTTTSGYREHKHYYTLRIQALNRSYTDPKMVTVTRMKSNEETKEFISTYTPSTYSDNTHTGRYFKGDQKCEVKICHAFWGNVIESVTVGAEIK